jgi:glutamine synthetase
MLMRNNMPGTNPEQFDYTMNKASASDSILKEARDAGVRLVRCLLPDLSGIIRGRAIHIDALRQHVISGMGMPANTMGLTMMDHQAMPDLRGQVRLLPDPKTFRIITYAPNTAVMLGDLYETDLQPWALCPRTFLRRMLADMSDLGLRMQIGFELEFVFGVRGNDGSYIPVDESLYSSSVGMTVTAKVINEIVGALDEQHIPIDHYHPESGFGQQEIVLRPTDPLTACDQLVLARETIRAIAWTHGWYASFMARPFESQPPSGLHAHLSMWDRYAQNLIYKQERPATEDAETQRAVSDEAQGFLAGALQHLAALTALACPTVNSYRRLTPQAPVAPYAAWGYDNRQAMIRMVPLSWAEGSPSANVEFKLADPTCNPYLMVGGLVAAGMDGVAKHSVLPAPLQTSPASLSAEEREQLGITALPATLAAACDLLAQDEVLAAALNQPMLETYLALKREEVKTFEGTSFSAEQQRHFWKF